VTTDPQVPAGTLDLAPFQPTKTQALAKARLQAALANRVGLVSVESLTVDELVAMGGDARVKRWLKDPDFVSWYTDRDTFVHNATALKETALQVLADILTSPRDRSVQAKDQIKAADLLFQLTGAYPKTNQVKFLDRDLDNMPEADVDRLLIERGVDPAKLR
jgi:hypothetical protein